MKRATLLVLTAIATGIVASVVMMRSPSHEVPPYPPHLIHVLEQIRTMHLPNGSTAIGSSVRGFGAGPHPFFILSQYVAAVALPPESEAMMHDPNPGIRVVGAMSFLGSRLNVDRSRVDFLLSDKSPVLIIDDCIPTRSTVGQIVGTLKQNPWAFDKNKSEPNKAPEPTAGSVRLP